MGCHRAWVALQGFNYYPIIICLIMEITCDGSEVVAHDVDDGRRLEAEENRVDPSAVVVAKLNLNGWMGGWMDGWMDGRTHSASL
jgi:hypothetical protein